jgi:hypothetical protein
MPASRVAAVFRTRSLDLGDWLKLSLPKISDHAAKKLMNGGCHDAARSGNPPHFADHLLNLRDNSASVDTAASNELSANRIRRISPLSNVTLG